MRLMENICALSKTVPNRLLLEVEAHGRRRDGSLLRKVDDELRGGLVVRELEQQPQPAARY